MNDWSDLLTSAVFPTLNVKDNKLLLLNNFPNEIFKGRQISKVYKKQAFIGNLSRL